MFLIIIRLFGCEKAIIVVIKTHGIDLMLHDTHDHHFDHRNRTHEKGCQRMRMQSTGRLDDVAMHGCESATTTTSTKTANRADATQTRSHQKSRTQHIVPSKIIHTICKHKRTQLSIESVFHSHMFSVYDASTHEFNYCTPTELQTNACS